MKTTTNKIIKYIVAFVIITFVELGLLVAVALIPKSSIKDNVYESATYLTSNDVFYKINEYDKSSVIDHYADSILMGIAYSYDENEPVNSVLKSGYYHQDTANENDNLLAAVQDNLEPNLEYSRYWHGSIVVVRPLLTIFNIKQLYINLIIVTLALLICQLLFLKKYINLKFTLAMLIAYIMVSVWYVPLSLEYVWTFLIMLIASIIGIMMYQKGKRDFSIFFFVLGSITAYFDFLTTETITLLIPLIILLGMLEKSGELNDFKTGFKTLFFSAIKWGAGYASAFIAKWTIASIILQKNCFADALSQAGYRIGGETADVSLLGKVFSAIARNLSSLFPFSFMGKAGYGVAILTIIAILIIYYLFKNTKRSCYFSNLMFLIAVIPYLRYIVLSNHSYIHYFFTYRAQVITILCLCLALMYGIKKGKH